MFDSIRFRYVGLDVHAESITIAVADESGRPLNCWERCPMTSPRSPRSYTGWGQLRRCIAATRPAPRGLAWR